MKKILILVLIFAAVAFLVLFWNNISRSLPQIKNAVTDFINLEFTQPVQKIFAPEPLRYRDGNSQAFLTVSGVIELTNIQRERGGVSQLRENTKLDSSAMLKAEDMLKNQYFAHKSPAGRGVDDLAKTEGYDFIIIGENLALGNFKDDEALVQAWMDSPGHRANILNEKYQEIGVAVLRGVFEGQTTWLAVQHFGEPLSSCPEPDANLKSQIQMDQTQILMLQTELDNLRNQIENGGLKGNPAGIEDYNNAVSRFNSIIEENKNATKLYNEQVQAFNACVNAAE